MEIDCTVGEETPCFGIVTLQTARECGFPEFLKCEAWPAFLNVGKDNDCRRFTPSSDVVDFGNELLLFSIANLLAIGLLNPLLGVAVLFRSKVTEEFACGCPVELLFLSQALSLLFMLLMISNGLLIEWLLGLSSISFDLIHDF